MPSTPTRIVNIGFRRHFSHALRTCGFIFVGLLISGDVYSQNPVPSPSPAPTPITKTGSILVNSPSTVGRLTKWVGSSNNGIGTIGDSVITESSIGTIGIGTNPFSDFKLGVDGGSLGGLFGRSTASGTGVFGSSVGGIGLSGFSNGGTGVFGQSNTGWAGFFQGRVNVTGLFSTGNLSLNPGGTLQFADGTIQSTAFTGQINQSQVINLIPALASKANDSGVVHLSGTETITGAKTFNGFQLFSGNLGIGMHGPTTDTLLNVGGNTGVVAGTFTNNHNTSVNDALYAVHTGRGNAFHAVNTQVIGRAGFFENSHTSSSSPVLEALGHGSGPAFKTSNTGSGLAGLFEGNVTINGTLKPTDVNATGVLSTGNLLLNPGGTLTFSDGTIQSTASKITGVIAGTGLTGGGTVGNLTIGIAPAGVNTNQIANGAITFAKLAPGAVVTSVNGLTDNVTLAAGNNVELTPSGNTLTISAAGVTAPLILTGGSLESPVDAVIQGRNEGDRYGIAGYSTYGIGVYGKSDRAQQGIGVYGEGIGGGSNGGIGVFGRNDLHIGVQGQGSTAVQGIGNTGNGVGVGGLGNSFGVVGDSPGGVGVFGKSISGLAGRFDGNVTINGGLNVTSVNANNLSNVGTINLSSNPVDWSALKK